MRIDIVEPNRRQTERLPRRVVIRQAVIPRPLDINRHEIPSRELQRSENVPAEILDDLVVLLLARLRRHAHQKSVDVHNVAFIGHLRQYSILRSPIRVARTHCLVRPSRELDPAPFPPVIAKIHPGNDQRVPESHSDRLEELVDLRIYTRIVPFVASQRLPEPYRQPRVHDDVLMSRDHPFPRLVEDPLSVPIRVQVLQVPRQVVVPAEP